MNTPSLSALLAPLVLAIAPSEAEAGGGISLSYRSAGPRAGLHLQASLGTPIHSYARRRATPSHCADRPVRRIWVPGHYAWVTRRHWVPGPTRQVWIPATHGVVYDACGRPRTVLVSAGRWETSSEPGRYVESRVRTWRPGAWQGA